MFKHPKHMAWIGIHNYHMCCYLFDLGCYSYGIIGWQDNWIWVEVCVVVCLGVNKFKNSSTFFIWLKPTKVGIIIIWIHNKEVCYNDHWFFVNMLSYQQSNQFWCVDIKKFINIESQTPYYWNTYMVSTNKCQIIYLFKI
jgi:hypothetical protein